MKRTGSDIPRPSTILPYVDFRILPPIPQSEIDSNPNLVQNTGY
ncbi:MAG: RagB/SusD family nutrient uptake outer membrane protein [Chloroflexia bacterium]|nr:RagB/SusD family nutrient uptake outer membrane protein [Chloroflexia bacterium]